MLIIEILIKLETFVNAMDSALTRFMLISFLLVHSYTPYSFLMLFFPHASLSQFVFSCLGVIGKYKRCGRSFLFLL